MSVKIVRYTALEGGNWSINDQRTISILVPPSSSGFRDTHNSAIVFRTQATVVDTAGTNRIYPVVFADPTFRAGGTPLAYVPTTAGALIRHAKVTYENAPSVENELMQPNVYYQNIDWNLTSRGTKASMAVFNGSANYNYGTIAGSGLPNSPFIQYSRLAVIPGAGGTTALTVPSQMRVPDLRVPLKYADQLADGMRQFPSSAFGLATYLLQLENTINVVAPAQMPQLVACDNVTTADANGVGSALNRIPLTERYTTNLRLQDVPLYVSAPLNVVMTVGGTQVRRTTVVTGLYVTDAGTVSFTCNPALPAGNAAACTAISFSYEGYDPTAEVYTYPDPADLNAGAFTGISASWQVQNVWAEMMELTFLPEQQRLAVEALRNVEMAYTYVTQTKKIMQYDVPAGQIYSDVIQYNPGCIGVAIMTPQGNSLTSGFDEAKQYRNKINGKDVDGIWVVVGPDQEVMDVRLGVGRQYHNYLLDRYLQRLGKKLKQLDAPNFNYANYTDYNTHAWYPMAINDPGPGTVGIDIQANAAMANKPVYYYFHYNRMLQISGGRVVQA